MPDFLLEDPAYAAAGPCVGPAVHFMLAGAKKMVLSEAMATEQRDWNQDYLEGHTPWDKGSPSPALLEVIASGELPAGSEVLVPGCGYGHDVSALADSGCTVTGLDVSESAVAGAKLANAIEGASYRVGDFFDPQLASKKRYDVIWEHTCFCAITPDERDDYVEAAYRLLQPRGLLIGVFFAFAEEPDVDGPPFKTNIENIHSHFGKRFALEWERRPKKYFPTREGEEWLMSWRRS